MPNDRMAQTIEATLEALKTQQEAALRSLLDSLNTLSAEEHQTTAREGLAAAQADADRLLEQARSDHRQAALADRLARLIEAVRELDRARSLSEVLDTLIDRASQEAMRVAVLLVSGDRLRGWRFAGLELDARSVDLPLSDPMGGVVVNAVRMRMPCTVTADEVGNSHAAPAFAALDSGGTGLAVPIDVGGQVVAVIYADDGARVAATAPGAWPDAVELLARHAARCLEALTVLKFASVQAAPHPEDQSGDSEESARRYARLLVSEIKLYHETAVSAGRREHNLLERLGGEIDRARRQYDERIPAAARADHFNQELVRTLADGDPSLLGHAS